MLKKVYDLRIQRLSAEDHSHKALELDSQIADTGRTIDANNRIIAQFDKQVLLKSKLVDLSKEEARLASRYATAQAKAGSGLQEVKQLQAAYQRLTTSYREYDTAKKAGNYTGMAYWRQSADGAIQEVRAIERKLATLNLEEGTRKRLLDLIQRAAGAEAAHAKGVGPLSQMTNQIGNRMLQMVSVTALLRTLSTVWRNAVSYGKEYYDLLNEIRIVSGKSAEQADEMGQRFRALAKDMKVSSTEIAKAAVEYYRQGLGDTEVDARLEATIMYSKIASMEFDDAAKIMTSAVNTMDVDAMRVASTWAYLGDESASG